MSRRASATRRWGLLPRIALDEQGDVAVEFGLIAPLLIGLSMAIFEFILLLYDYQSATDAARMAVRSVIVGDTLYSLDTLSSTQTITCIKANSTSDMLCNFATNSDTDQNADFNAAVTAAQVAMPTITHSNVQVTYSWSTVDDGQLTTALKTPMVTVDLTGVTHDILFLDGFFGLPTTVNLPNFTSSRLGHSQF